MERLWVWQWVDSGSYGVVERTRHSEPVRQRQCRRGRRRAGAAVSGGRATVGRRVCGGGFVAGARGRDRCAVGGTGRLDRAI